MALEITLMKLSVEISMEISMEIGVKLSMKQSMNICSRLSRKKIALLGLVLGGQLIGEDFAFAKSFYEYCLAPADQEQQDTVDAIMLKLGVWGQASPENCTLTQTRLNETQYLTLWPDPLETPRNPARSLHPIEASTQLLTLSVAKNEILDISPLANLINLTYLNINFNPVSDITALSHLVQLKELNAVQTNVSDLAPLAKLGRLEALYLSDSRVVDLTPLHGLRLIDKWGADELPLNARLRAI